MRKKNKNKKTIQFNSLGPLNYLFIFNKIIHPNIALGVINGPSYYIVQFWTTPVRSKYFGHCFGSNLMIPIIHNVYLIDNFNIIKKYVNRI